MRRGDQDEEEQAAPVDLEESENKPEQNDERDDAKMVSSPDTPALTIDTREFEIDQDALKAERDLEFEFHCGTGQRLTSLRGTRVADLGKYSVILGQTIISHNLACGIAFMCPTYPVLLTDAEIVQNGIVGAVVSQGASPTIRSVHFDKGPVGIRVERAACPLVTRCTFMSQSDSAIHVTERARGAYRLNELNGFNNTGITIDSGAHPSIRYNKLRQSSGVGILAREGALGLIEMNRTFAVNVGVEVTSSADPYVVRNPIDNAAQSGIFVRHDGVGTFEQNVILRCHIGVAVGAEGSPVIRNNHVLQCVSVGALLSSGSDATVEKNVFDRSIRGNVLLEGERSNSVVRANTVTNSSGFGILSADGAGGVVRGNFVVGNEAGGLCSASRGASLFTRNKVTNERGSGIKCHADAASVFVKNVVHGASYYGLELCTGSKAVIDQCDFTHNETGGVAIHSGSRGRVIDCVVARNRKRGLHLIGDKCYSDTDFINVTFDANDGPAYVAAKPDARVSMSRCIFRNHTSISASAAIELEAASSALFSHCLFERNIRGVIASRGGATTFQACVFRHNGVADMELHRDGSIKATKCAFTSSPVAVVARNHAKGEFTRCRFEKHVLASVITASEAVTTVMKCKFVHCHIAVVGVADSSSMFGGNVIQFSTGPAALVSLVGDSSRYVNNTVQYACGHGILAESGSHAHFVQNQVTFPCRSGLVVAPSDENYEQRYKLLKSVTATPDSNLTPTLDPTQSFLTSRPRMQKDKTPASVTKAPTKKHADQAESDDDGLESQTPAHDAELAPSSIGHAPSLDTTEDPRSIDIGSLVRELKELEPPATFAEPVAFDRRGFLKQVLQLAQVSAKVFKEVPQATHGAKEAVLAMQRAAFTSSARKGAEVEPTKPLDPTVSGPSSAPQVLAADERRQALPTPTLIIRDNTFSNATEFGVAVAPLSLGVAFSGNVVEHNNRGGFVCHGEAEPLIEGGNRIHQNLEGGVIVLACSKPFICGNFIRHNSPCNVLLRDHSAGRVLCNEIDAGEPHGVVVEAYSTTEVTRNTLMNHRSSGHALTVRGSAPKLVVKENTFVDNLDGIIVDGDNAAATICDNNFLRCEQYAVQLRTNTNATVRSNQFVECNVGVMVDYDAAGRVESNTFVNNHHGMSIVGQLIRTDVFKNTFRANSCGVVIRSTESLTLHHNDFTDHTDSAVQVEGGGSTRILNCRFTADQVGVSSAGGSVPRVLACVFHESVGCGVSIGVNAGAMVERCQFNHCHVGVMCQSTRSRDIACIRSVFLNSEVAGWISESGGSPGNVSRCVFARGRGPRAAGILLRDGGMGTFADCDIHFNTIGVLVTSYASGELHRLCLHDNSCGIEVCGMAAPVVTACTLQRHKRADLVVYGGGAPLVKKCMLRSPGRAVVLGDKAAGLYSFNTIRDALFGVTVSGSQSSTVSSNFITNCGVGVQFAHARSHTTVSGNYIASCGHGVSCATGSSGEATGNLITACEVNVVVEAAARLVLTHNTLSHAQRASCVLRGRGPSSVSLNRVTDNTPRRQTPAPSPRALL
jgi:nitrous oxidase accessory protein NosD